MANELGTKLVLQRVHREHHANCRKYNESRSDDDQDDNEDVERDSDEDQHDQNFKRHSVRDDGDNKDPQRHSSTDDVDDQDVEHCDDLDKNDEAGNRYPDTDMSYENFNTFITLTSTRIGDNTLDGNLSGSLVKLSIGESAHSSKRSITSDENVDLGDCAKDQKIGESVEKSNVSNHRMPARENLTRNKDVVPTKTTKKYEKSISQPEYPNIGDIKLNGSELKAGSSVRNSKGAIPKKVKEKKKQMKESQTDSSSVEKDSCESIKMGKKFQKQSGTSTRKQCQRQIYNLNKSQITLDAVVTIPDINLCSSKSRGRPKGRTQSAIGQEYKKKKLIAFEEKEDSQKLKLVLELFLDPKVIKLILTGESLLTINDIPTVDFISDAFPSEDIKLDILRDYSEDDVVEEFKKRVGIKKERNVYTCRQCLKEVKGDCVLCEECLHWYHYACIGRRTAPNVKLWFCHKCIKKHGGKH